MDEELQPPADLTPAQRLLSLAMHAHRNNRPEQAATHYQALLGLEPDNADALHLYGLLHAQRGDMARAHELIGRALAANPHEPMFHNNLGNSLLELERYEEAERHYRAAVALDPQRYDARSNLAVLLSRRGELDEAIAAFEALLAEAPGFADARENLATTYLRAGKLEQALRECARGLITAPRSPALRRVMGAAYGAAKMFKQAEEAYRHWLEVEPGSVEARHHLAAFRTDDLPDRAPDDYVRHTFDAFADSFDAKLAFLDYQAPALVARAVAEALGAPTASLRVADAGCGTGLCAKHLRPYARSLVGVDLSEGMLKRAARRSQYDELYAGDLTEFLRQRQGAFDLLVAADTLCYFGALEAFAAAARASLASGGWLVFTVEAHAAEQDGRSWRLQPHGRYSHQRSYVQQVLGGAGFAAPRFESVVLRQEAREPVQGWLICATAAEAC